MITTFSKFNESCAMIVRSFFHPFSFRFLHVSREDEEQYRATGRVPTHLIEQAIRKAILDDMAPAGVTQPCKVRFLFNIQGVP